MQNDTGDRILRVRVDRTAGQTGGLDAMIAAHRQMQPLGVRVPSTLDFTDSSPVDVGRIAVLLVASDNTTLATDALGHVEMKSVLLPRQESTLRDFLKLRGDGSPHWGESP
jgi:hypothetical protein